MLMIAPFSPNYPRNEYADIKLEVRPTKGRQLADNGTIKLVFPATAPEITVLITESAPTHQACAIPKLKATMGASAAADHLLLKTSRVFQHPTTPGEPSIAASL